ncbi:MAG: nickel ABC transporter substrate-binding protein [Deltaproteobacteria bacterium]|jgi:nickel transport system substrate-binding protein|nr:nickel ABC transporter substrate-binding protein [Deltaproteobacteria bacterium]
MSKQIIFALALTLSFIFMPTAQSSADPTTIVYSFPVNVGPGNPHLYLPNQVFMQQMIYDKLVSYGKGGVIEPCLAESWDVSEDGLTYVFHLRKDVKFSDGEPFNAEAAVKNFDTIMLNRKRHGWQEITNKLEKWEAAGEFDLKLTLNSPYANTMNDFAAFRPYRFLSPKAFPDSGFTADGIKAPIGTGPWKLTETVPNEYNLFERNDLYWGPKPQAEKVLIKVIPDPLTRAVALETGEIDLIYGSGQIGFDVFDRFSKDPKYVTSISDPLLNNVVALNTGRFPTNDKAVRLALNYITNRDEIIQGLYLGHLQPAYFLCNKVFKYCDLDLKPYPFDVELAAKTLEEAGWILPPGQTIREKDGKKLDVPFSFISTDATHKSVVEAMQAQAKKAGINIIALGEEADIYLSHNREGNFNMVLIDTYSAPLEPVASLSAMRSPTNTDHQAQAGLPQKAQIDELIGKMVSSVKEEDIANYVKEILTFFHDEAVYVPLIGVSIIEVHRKGELDNVTFDTDNNHIAFEKMIKLK